MKTLYSKNYVKFIEAQHIVNWDDLSGEPININEFSDTEEPEISSLPVIRQEDIGKILEDDLELGSEVVPENAPVVEELPEISTEERPRFSNKYDAIDWAKEHNEVIRINYTTEHNTNLNRDVEPHGTFYARTTHRTILVVFDRTVNAIRAFIIKNINALDFTGNRFQKKFVVRAWPRRYHGQYSYKPNKFGW